MRRLALRRMLAQHDSLDKPECRLPALTRRLAQQRWPVLQNYALQLFPIARKPDQLTVEIESFLGVRIPVGECTGPLGPYRCCSRNHFG